MEAMDRTALRIRRVGRTAVNRRARRDTGPHRPARVAGLGRWTPGASCGAGRGGDRSSAGDLPRIPVRTGLRPLVRASRGIDRVLPAAGRCGAGAGRTARVPPRRVMTAMSDILDFYTDAPL